VANNLNDILKDNPHIALETLQKWAALNNTHTHWIVKHALRNRLKQKDPEALELLRRIGK
jgi:3-methyladenine DNA glycosylase AlkC